LQEAEFYAHLALVTFRPPGTVDSTTPIEEFDSLDRLCIMYSLEEMGASVTVDELLAFVGAASTAADIYEMFLHGMSRFVAERATAGD
jgi:hypothetical protein